MIAFPDFAWSKSKIIGTIYEIFTWTHHFSSHSAVAGITKGVSCLLGVGLDTDNQNPGMFGTQMIWSQIITVPMSPALNVQLHFLASSILIQPFRRQRSLFSGCYSSEQWVLGLVTENGVDGEINKFSQFQNEELSWRTDLEIVRRSLLCSQWQHCGHGCVRNIFESPHLGYW